ncbi:MAG TPA: tail fiber domain-containing protein [Ohtaekwangia sp.]|uniref:tail fiber domain-containing protein n=1 Tax=Ohtaekwangia sp. TaxID=2066019 RepID=UPI002F937C04
MKKFKLVIFFYIGVFSVALAQNIGINSTGAAPAPSAMLDIASPSSGLLIPRVALTATNAAGPITSPATSLLVYNTATAGTAPNNVVPGYYYWSGSAWLLVVAADAAGNLRFSGALMPNNSAGTSGYILQSNGTDNAPTWISPSAFVSGTGWALDGNNVAAQRTLGTTSNFDLPFITNNIERMRLTTAGGLGLGSNTFDGTNPEKLLVDAGTTTSYNLMTGKGSIDNYLQINVRNNSAGGSASSDVVATSNNGSESANYIDMGINSGGYTNTTLPVLGGANTAYLYSTGNDFVIGNGTATRPIRFFTGGFTNANERLRIDGTGRVGIANSAPTEALDVTGNFRLSGAFMPNNLPGTSGFILQSNGTDNAPAWISPSSFISGTGWALDGNNVAALRTLGTTSNFDLPFITNNTERMRLTTVGSLGLGSSTFDGTNPEKLLVDAGTTTSYNLMTGRGSIDNYLQINVKNNSAGTSASSDLVATSNNGTESVNYIDMGINSGSYSNTTLPVLGGTNTAYLYSTGNDFVIGNGTATRPIRFFTGGFTNANERLRIDGTGRVGIANTAPTEVLDVTGNFRLSGAFMPNNLPGTSGFILQSNGTGTAPTWIAPSSLVSGTGWALDGNSVAAARNFGTTSNFDLPFITNNTEKMRLTATGSLGLGSSTFDATNREKLLVDAGTTTSYNLMTGRGSIDNYLQINVKNNSAGTSASSDLVATSNNGTESVNYIDMGINSGSYSNTSLPVLGGTNTAYLYATGNDFVIGNGTASRPIRFFTGGFANANERLRIDGTGKVGVNNLAPTEALDVTGNLRLSGAFMPNNAAGTTGNILQSNGAGNAPTWVTPASVIGSTSWSLDGNNVAAARNFGTTTNFDLPFITNNTEQMRITATGSIGIGTSTVTDEKVLIDAEDTQTALSMIGNINDFLEMNIQNSSNGALASSDIVATANNGTENSVYVDLGINSAGYSNGNSNILNGANLAYLYANANDFKIGNGSPSRNLVFFTNPTGGVLGTNTANGLERMRISSAGFVGIGTASPTHLLHLGADDAAKPGGGSWTTPSDRRLKKDIASFTDGLNVLTRINPVTFRYNGKGGMPNDGKSHVGVIAQDMQQIAPYTISTFRDDDTNTDYLSYNPNAITYVLINAVKEQQALIEELKKQLEEQAKRLLSLESSKTN